MTDTHQHAAPGVASSPGGRLPCPVCGSVEERPVVTLRDVPVLCGALFETPDEASAAVRGDIELIVCPTCSMFRNAAYDGERVEYDGCYDNSLHFSPTFQAYADDLAQRLVGRYDLRGGTVIEVGSGKGDFLRQLCRLGANQGWGFDPAYAGEQDDAEEEVTFVRDYFSGTLPCAPDLACARHVLEHLSEPAKILRDIHRVSHDRSVLYAEVPDVRYVLTTAGLWDLIYPHVGYFTAAALRRLAETCGFTPLEVSTSFGGQYLWIEARARVGDAPVTEPPADDVGDVLELAKDFARLHRDTVDRWAERLDHAAQAGQRVALWGAGTKGVSFLNVVPGGAGIADVVDVNPRKRGRFVPGTGQAVVGPDDLPAADPDLVLIMNPNYRDEIQRWLAAAGLDSAVAMV